MHSPGDRDEEYPRAQYAQSPNGRELKPPVGGNTFLTIETKGMRFICAACTIMYVRFVTPLVHPASRVESGFFQASWYLDRIGAPRWIHDELEKELEWFNTYLPIPGRLGRAFKRRRTIWGICWFDPSFKEAISRAHYCAWLIEEGGLPVQTIKTGKITREVIWQDPFQIVCKPTADTPRAFH